MATRMYLSRDAAPYSPATRRGAWDTSTLVIDNWLTRRRRGSANTSGTAAEASATNNFDRIISRFVSDPLGAQTISGTLDLAIPCRESNANANDVLHIHLYVTQGDSDTPRGTLITDYIDSTEFVVNATTFDVISITGISISSLAVSAGDRLVLEVGYQGQNTDATSYNAAHIQGGSTSDATAGATGISAGDDTKAPWIEFSGNLVWTWTYLYLTSSAAPVTPGAIRGTWDETAAYDDFKLGTAPAGARSTRVKTETVTTNPYAMLAARYVSDELAAQTIDQDIQFQKNLYESSASADAFAKYHLYVMKSDGTVRGTLLSNIIGGSELNSAGLVAREPVQTPTSVACSAQDRLVLEVGPNFTNTVSTSFNSSVKSGGPSGEFRDGEGIASDTEMTGFIIFKQLLSYYTAPTSKPSQVIVAMA